MRYLTVLGLTAVAALTLTAGVDVSSASALGKICSTSGTGTSCGAHGAVFNSGEFHAVLDATTGTNEVHSVSTSSFIQVTCSSSTIQGDITNGATGTGHIDTMTFTQCTNNINNGPCTLSAGASHANPWHLTADPIGTTGNAHLTVSNMTRVFTCNVFFANRTCRYQNALAGGTEEITLTTSHTTPVIHFKDVPLSLEPASDGLCSSTAKWSAVYHVTTPTSLSVTPTG